MVTFVAVKGYLIEWSGRRFSTLVDMKSHLDTDSKCTKGHCVILAEQKVGRQVYRYVAAVRAGDAGTSWQDVQYTSQLRKDEKASTDSPFTMTLPSGQTVTGTLVNGTFVPSEPMVSTPAVKSKGK